MSRSNSRRRGISVCCFLARLSSVADRVVGFTACQPASTTRTLPIQSVEICRPYTLIMRSPVPCAGCPDCSMLICRPSSSLRDTDRLLEDMSLTHRRGAARCRVRHAWCCTERRRMAGIGRVSMSSQRTGDIDVRTRPFEEMDSAADDGSVARAVSGRQCRLRSWRHVRRQGF